MFWSYIPKEAMKLKEQLWDFIGERIKLILCSLKKKHGWRFKPRTSLSQAWMTKHLSGKQQTLKYFQKSDHCNTTQHRETNQTHKQQMATVNQI